MLKESDPKKTKLFCGKQSKSKLSKIFADKETTFIITRVIIDKGDNPFDIIISGGVDQPLEDGTTNGMAVIRTVSTNPNSPVYNKLFPGDCIISLDGQNMAGMKHDDIVNLFGSKVGTVTMDVKRTVKSKILYKNFNTIMVKHRWQPSPTDQQYSEYGFEFQFHSWPSFCQPNVKNVVVTSVNVNGPAYGTILPRDIIISVNNQILYGYTHCEIDNMIKSCNGKVVLEILRKTKSDASRNLIYALIRHIHTTVELLRDTIKNDNGFTEEANSQMKIVKLTKESGEKYGFGIFGGVEGCPLFVANVDAFSHAETAEIKSCSLIHRINSKVASFMTHEDAVRLISNTNTLELLLEYSEKLHQDLQKFFYDTKSPSNFNVLDNSTDHSVAIESQTDFSASPCSSNDIFSRDNECVFDNHLEPLRQFTVKTLFDFNAETEKSLPARGLTFQFGDLLQVTNGNDDEWWQAAALNSTGSLNRKKRMGLIPSQNLLNYRLQRKSKKVKFTSKVERITPKNSISTNTQKTAVKNLNSATVNKSSLVKKNYNNLTATTVSSQNATTSEFGTLSSRTSKKTIDSFSAFVNNDDVMYLIVEQVNLDSGYKRPVFIIGSYAERIQIALEKEHSHIYQFLSYPDPKQQIPSLKHAIEQILEKSKAGVHTLIAHNNIPLDIIHHTNLHMILLMFKPPSVEWIMRREKHLTYDEATVELNYFNRIQNKYRHYFTRIIPAPDAFEDALNITYDVIEENSSSQIWIPVINVTQF